VTLDRLTVFQDLLDSIPSGSGRQAADFSPAEKILQKHLNLAKVRFFKAHSAGLALEGLSKSPEIPASSALYRHLIRTRKSWEKKTKAIGAPEWDLLVPVFSGETLLGAIALGPKKNKKPFSSDEKSFLGLVSFFFREPLEAQALWAQVGRLNRQAALGFLSGMLAHEIRNPLTALQTLLQLFPQKSADEKFRADFQKIMMGEVQRLQYLSENYLSWLKAEPALEQVLDLGPVAARAVELLKPLFKAKGAEISLQTEGPVWIQAGAFQLESLLLNLAQNAYHALPEKKGRVIISVRRAGRLKERPGGGNWAELQVSDNGRGIPKENLKKIFDPFFTTRADSAGLGLLICRQIVEMFRGFLTVSGSRPGKTIFKAYFPLISRP
jgi:two-component system sensor histidine kinase HydH